MKSVIMALVIVAASFQASAQVTKQGFPGFKGKPAPTGVPNMPIINPALFGRVAKLTNLRIDRNHAQNLKIESAEVEVNAVRKAVTLTLEPKQPCRPALPGQPTCMAFIAPIVIKLALIETKTDSCGATVYVAKLDNRPRDGALQVIEVTDNTTMTCRIHLAADRMTEVLYTTEALRGGRDRSELTGTALVSRRF